MENERQTYQSAVYKKLSHGLNCYTPLRTSACGCIALAGYVIINGRKHGEHHEAQARSPVLYGRKR